jgi:hypothetical protein
MNSLSYSDAVSTGLPAKVSTPPAYVPLTVSTKVPESVSTTEVNSDGFMKIAYKKKSLAILPLL